MDPEVIAAAITAALPYSPNKQQSLVIGALSRFCAPVAEAAQAMSVASGNDREAMLAAMAAQAPALSADYAFILAGYAGTGKTSLTGALVRALGEAGVTTVLLAPTGRAAKVFAANAAHPAYTIHRRIYRHSLDGSTWPGLQENRLDNAVFIVDEASMISGEPGLGGTNSLLEDLIQYVYSGIGNRLIFLGDTAQLPPVGSDDSPAMNPDALRSFGLKVSRATLTAISRQTSGSGILYNATSLRRAMAEGEICVVPRLTVEDFDDVSVMGPEDLPEALESAYRRDGIDRTLLITRSNQRATAFNRAIRTEVLYLDSIISRGEQILVAKNNYFWSRKEKGLDFIANGDIAVVAEVYGTERRYGFTFADVALTFPDHGVTLDCKLVLDTLGSDTPALTYEQQSALYNGILCDDSLYDTGDYALRARQVRNSPYWNALQVKYAYAVTCHKAQGGQWDNVFVDMGYIPPEAAGLDLYRWLYTAVTRARRRLTILDTRPD